ncbi:MAG: hypothetical protein IKA64_05175 [Clostridia bacterium]|nr:hypothetical protein [Clostridia bacterium]
MGKRENDKFLESYNLLERTLCERFLSEACGVSEYINRLGALPDGAPRDEVLSALVRYRGIRNRLSHEPTALRRSDEVTLRDVHWLRRFRRTVSALADPLSRYLRGERRKRWARTLVRILIYTLTVALAAAVVIIINI